MKRRNLGGRSIYGRSPGGSVARVGGAPAAPAVDTAKWMTGLAAMRAGTRDATIGFVGDSLTLGLSAGAVQNLNRQASAAKQLSDLYVAAGIPSNFQGIFGTGAGAATIADVDSRISGTGGWAQSASGSLFTAGGPVMATTIAGTLSFTPTIQVDTFVIRYPLRTAANNPGTWNYNVDGGSNTLVDSTTAGTDRTSASVTINVAKGNHTLNIAWASGTANIGSVEAYDSTTKSIRVRNFGWTASTSTLWVGASYGTAPLNELVNLACDAYVICIQDNDITTGIALATSSSQLSTIISTLKAVGSVFLMSCNPMNTTQATAAAQDTFVAMLRERALFYGVQYIDGYEQMGGGDGYATYSAAPYSYYADDKHLNATGQAQRAALEYAVIPKILAP
jgi:hypothetical protein